MVFGLLSVAAFMIKFPGDKGAGEACCPGGGERTGTNVPFAEGIKALFRNKYWLMMTGMLALFFLNVFRKRRLHCLFTQRIYWAARILVAFKLTAFSMWCRLQACSFIAMLVKRLGKRNVFSLGLVLDIIGMLVLNFSGGSIGIIIVSSIIRGLGNACGGATMWAMVSDTIDYGEWKTGYRTEGLVNSACSLDIRLETESDLLF